MKRPHLVISDEPVKAGTDLKALCGAPVPKAEFAFVWDGDIMGKYDLKLGACCVKCLKYDINLRYVYGVLEGSEYFDRSMDD